MIDIELLSCEIEYYIILYLPFMYFSIVATEIPIATGSSVLMSLLA